MRGKRKFLLPFLLAAIFVSSGARFTFAGPSDAQGTDIESMESPLNDISGAGVTLIAPSEFNLNAEPSQPNLNLDNLASDKIAFPQETPIQPVPKAEAKSLGAPEQTFEQIEPSPFAQVIKPASTDQTHARTSSNDEHSTHQTLFQTLSVPMPDFSKSDDASQVTQAETDFETRAQLEKTPGTTVSEDVVLPKNAQTALAERKFHLRPNLSNDEIIAAYQDGTLEKKGVSPEVIDGLETVTSTAIHEKLQSAKFKTLITYGLASFSPTFIYESPDLPGLIIKRYSFRKKAAAWIGYNLAKMRLGGLFADTTIIKNVTLNIDGKKKHFPWLIAQERVNNENIVDYRNNARRILYAMEKRGVSDKEPVQYDRFDFHLGMGETQDGRFVHFDADLFVATKNAAKEAPVRVHDPEPLRSAIAKAQREYLESLRRGPTAH